MFSTISFKYTYLEMIDDTSTGDRWYINQLLTNYLIINALVKKVSLYKSCVI